MSLVNIKRRLCNCLVLWFVIALHGWALWCEPTFSSIDVLAVQNKRKKPKRSLSEGPDGHLRDHVLSCYFTHRKREWGEICLPAPNVGFCLELSAARGTARDLAGLGGWLVGRRRVCVQQHWGSVWCCNTKLLQYCC